MKITVGKILSWIFGLLFTLGGVGSMVQSPIGGLIMAITGIFLIPNVRQKIDEEYDISFSRWMVVLISVIGLGASSAFLPQQSLGDISDSSSPTSSTPGVSSSPDAAVQNYFDSLTGLSQDTESAYQMLSSDVQSETEYADYNTEMINLKDAQAGATYEMVTVETVNESESTATVAATITVDSLQGAYNVDKQVELVKEDSQWKIDEKMNPYTG
jgi:hypothetical protein